MENDKIKQFIIYDCVDFQDKYGFPDYRNYHIKNIQRIAQVHSTYRHAIKLLDTFYNHLLCKVPLRNKNSLNKPKILWYTTKNSFIFLNLKNSDFNIELIPSGIKDRLFAIKHNIKYNNLTDMFEYINNYISTNDPQHLTNLLGLIESKLNIINPDYVVLQGDSLPVERALILICRQLGITTINIQEGVYQSQVDPPFGKVSDYVFVWGEHFKDIYVNRKIKTPDKVHIIGYPFEIKSLPKNRNEKLVVYCLGDNYEIYNIKYLGNKIKTLEGLNKICSKIGMSFYYRPHPGDNVELLQKLLPNINFSHETLEQSFIKGDIFIGFTSTTIPEASMRNKYTIQLRNYDIPNDNLEELGGCSKTIETLDELENYMINLIKLSSCHTLSFRKFNTSYIDITKNPSELFLNAINEIKNTK